MLFFGVLSLFNASLTWVLPGAGASFVVLIILAAWGYPGLKAFSNPANWITMIRLYILLAGVAFFARIPVEAFIGLMIIVLILDGLDGFLAREFHVATEFGALFDLETDALLAALLSLLVFSRTDIGPWVLLPGFMRYIFVLLKYFLAIDKVRLPRPLKGSKTIAVAFFSCLLGAFILPTTLMQFLLAVSGLSIMASFGVELVLLMKCKTRKPGPADTGARDKEKGLIDPF